MLAQINIVQKSKHYACTFLENQLVVIVKGNRNQVVMSSSSALGISPSLSALGKRQWQLLSKVLPRKLHKWLHSHIALVIKWLVWFYIVQDQPITYQQNVTDL